MRDGVHKLQQEVAGEPELRDSPTSITGKDFSGLDRTSHESKWPDYLNF